MATTTSKDWHPSKIGGELKAAGYNWREISRICEHESPYTARTVVRRHWPLMEAIVGRILGRHPSTIWPSRYEGGQPFKGGAIRRPELLARFPNRDNGNVTTGKNSTAGHGRNRKGVAA